MPQVNRGLLKIFIDVSRQMLIILFLDIYVQFLFICVHFAPEHSWNQHRPPTFFFFIQIDNTGSGRALPHLRASSHQKERCAPPAQSLAGRMSIFYIYVLVAKCYSLSFFLLVLLTEWHLHSHRPSKVVMVLARFFSSLGSSARRTSLGCWVGREPGSALQHCTSNWATSTGLIHPFA